MTRRRCHCQSDLLKVWQPGHILISCVLLATCSLGQTVNDLPSTTIGQRLTSFTNDALGVAATQRLYSGAVLTATSVVDGDATASTLASGIATRLSNRLTAVTQLRSAAASAYNLADTSSSLAECCRLTDSQVAFDARFNTTVRTSAGCDRISSTASSSPSRISARITSAAKSNLAVSPELKFQYFGSEEGYFTIYPGFNASSCTDYDPRYRPWYVAAAARSPKDVVVVVDTSGSMDIAVAGTGRTRLDLAKDALDSILTTLSDDDRVTIVPFGSGVGRLAPSTSNMSCFNTELGQVTPYTIRQLRYYVGRLSAGGGTQYSSAFREGFQRFSSTVARPNSQRIMLFLTDGQPGESDGPIFSALQAGEAMFSYQVVVLTYALGTGLPSNSVSLLQRIAQQRYSTSVGPVAAGEFQLVDDFNNLRARLSRYYSFFASESTSGEMAITMPYYDAFGLGVILTVASAVYTGSAPNFVLRGVVGVDITISDLFGDISYFSDAEHQYAFMINDDGEAVLHPLLSQPVDVSTDPLFQDITLLEPDAEFRTSVYWQMRNRTSGSATFSATRFVTVGNSRYEGTHSVQVNSSYFWRPISNTKFSLAIVLSNARNNEVNTLNAQSAASAATVYHRLDLQVSRGQRCSQYGYLALSDASAVKFAPEAFTNPSFYLNIPESLGTVGSYLSYLDGNGANTAFKTGVRNSVRLTAQLDNIWRSANAQTYERSVVWRYIGTIDGTFRLIPATQLPTSYDHTRRDWFTRALNRPGRMTLSAPYLDAFGSGFVVTLSHTITQSTSSTKVDAVGAVMGVDFTMGFLGQTLEQAYTQCAGTFRCILFDSAGYLIYHPDFVTSSVNPRWVHLGHKEPYVMNNLLQNGAAQKTSCSRYDIFQRLTTYRITIPNSYSSTLACGTSLSFKIEAISNSNIYIGFLSSTQCSGENQFTCRCSTANELGLCTSTAATTCECPCYSPLNYAACTNTFILPAVRDDVCPAEVAGLPVVPRRPDAVVGLEPCFNGTCSALIHSSDCRATQGCSWCTRNSQNLELLSSFCTTDCVCFGGQSGQTNPAGNCATTNNNNNNNNNNNDEASSSGLSTGAIAGIIIGGILFLIVLGALLTYCSKQSSSTAAASTTSPRRASAPPPGPEPSAVPEMKPYAPPPATNPNAPPDYNAAVHLGGSQPGYPTAAYSANPPYPTPYPPSTAPYPSSTTGLPYPT